MYQVESCPWKKQSEESSLYLEDAISLLGLSIKSICPLADDDHYIMWEYDFLNKLRFIDSLLIRYIEQGTSGAVLEICPGADLNHMNDSSRVAVKRLIKTMDDYTHRFILSSVPKSILLEAEPGLFGRDLYLWLFERYSQYDLFRSQRLISKIFCQPRLLDPDAAALLCLNFGDMAKANGKSYAAALICITKCTSPYVCEKVLNYFALTPDLTLDLPNARQVVQMFSQDECTTSTSYTDSFERPACYYCGSLQHFIRFCPKKKV